MLKKVAVCCKIISKVELRGCEILNTEYILETIHPYLTKDKRYGKMTFTVPQNCHVT